MSHLIDSGDTHPEAQYLTISQICRLIPGRHANTKVNPSTVTRWIQRGSRGPSGTRVKLAAVRVGGRWLVPVEALDAYIATLSASAESQTKTPQKLDLTTRRADQAAAELARRGA